MFSLCVNLCSGGVSYGRLSGRLVAGTDGITDKLRLSILDELINGGLGIGVNESLAGGSKVNSGHQVVSLVAQLKSCPRRKYQKLQ